VLTTDAVYAAFYDDAATRGFLHSHSYTGNALACRAALATLDIFETDNVLHNNVARGALLESLLQPLAEHPQVRHFRRRGMILAFDVDADAANSANFGRRFYREALARELLLRPMGNTVYFMPPYILSEDDAAFLATNAAAALEAALK
jgi:adenosylmethionine-8-amino-7-oxononanoate aminotransferase